MTHQVSIGNPGESGADISSVADELLTLIFFLALPDHLKTRPSECEAPISVSHVSRHWRKVALAAPELWSTVTLTLSGKPKFDESLWLGRSVRSSSSLASVNVNGHMAYDMTRMRANVTPYLHHIKHLEVWGSDLALHEFLEHGAPRLETLIFTYTTTSGQYSDSATWGPTVFAPNLTSLHIVTSGSLEPYIKVSLMGVPWANLTILVISTVCMYLDVMSVLPHCTALRSLELWLSELYNVPAESINTRPFSSFPHLTKISLTFGDKWESWLLLSRMRAPNLESLSISTRHPAGYRSRDSKYTSEGIIDFRFRSRFPLQHLTIDDVDLTDTEDPWKKCLDGMPTLRSLRFLRCPHQEDDDAPPATWLHKQRSHPGRPKNFLPVLKILEIQVQEDKLAAWHECALLIAKSRVSSGKTNTLKHIKIGAEWRSSRRYSKYDPPDSIPRRVQKQVKAFAAQGVELDLEPYELDEDYSD